MLVLFLIALISLPLHFEYNLRVIVSIHRRYLQCWRILFLLLLLYNCGMIFFILSFFVGYILSFGLVRLRTIRLSARAGTHIERRCSRSRAEDVTITDVIIKTPDRKWDRGANDVMLGSDGLGFLVIVLGLWVETLDSEPASSAGELTM